jgi:hypothetical protein
MAEGARTYAGGCLCGAIRYRVAAPGTQLCFCHCRSCRLACGAPFVAWGTFAAAGLVVDRGRIAEYASSPPVRRGFCATCGTPLTYQNQATPGEIDVTLATLDEPGPLAPVAHIWVSHKLPWVTLGDGLPQHAERAS